MTKANLPYKDPRDISPTITPRHAMMVLTALTRRLFHPDIEDFMAWATVTTQRYAMPVVQA